MASASPIVAADVPLAPAPVHSDPAAPSDVPITIIEPRSGWQLVNVREFIQYRDLLWFLTWRSIKILYAQSALGIGWAVIQPLSWMIVFTFAFGRQPSDDVPYVLFSLAALVPWVYFSNAVVEAAGSLVAQADMIRKVYFPRIILPLSSVFAKLIDFAIASSVLAVVLLAYGRVPNAGIFALPLLVLIMVIAAAGFGIWCTTLAIQFRDVKHGMNFLVQLLMFVSPVAYSVNNIPEKWRWLYALNPMVGVLEGFRSALLGTRSMPWDWIAIGACSAVVMFVTGLFYFRRQERIFADVA